MSGFRRRIMSLISKSKVTATTDCWLYALDSDHNYLEMTNVSNAYTHDVSSTSQATAKMAQGVGEVTYFYFKFNTSAIPANATIKSVSCIAKVGRSTSVQTRISNPKIQLASGYTLKGTATSVTGNTQFTMSPGTWTRQEISDAKLYYQATRGTESATNNYTIYVYAARLRVTYEI